MYTMIMYRFYFSVMKGAKAMMAVAGGIQCKRLAIDMTPEKLCRFVCGPTSGTFQVKSVTYFIIAQFQF